MPQETPLVRRVKDRAAFDALLASATNWERVPDFHAGRVRLDLDRMREYVARLGHPERASPVVHVTGTKGKGSVATLVARVLVGLGRSTGLHVSPHLHRMEERVTVGGEPIDEPALLAATNAVLDAAHADPVLGFPTYFELMTLVAFVHFRARGCEFAVHEVGMGGTLDATNVVQPAVTCVTNVALEHAAVLGPTVAAIAREKSGIIKAGAPLITGADGDALQVVLDAARQRGVAVRRLGSDVVPTRVAPRKGGMELDVRTWRAHYRNVRLGLRGRHQAGNLALALGIVDALRDQGLLECSEDAVVAALDGAAIPARLETVAASPEVIVDGAHTPESIAAAVEALHEEAAGQPIVAVFAIARDKDAARATLPLARVSHVFATTYGSERQADPQELARLVVAAGGRASVEPDLERALDRARHAVAGKGLVLVVGSLYLAASARAAMLGDAAAARGASSGARAKAS